MWGADGSFILAAIEGEPTWSLPLPEAGPLDLVVWPLVVLTLLHLCLRGLDRAGWIEYDGHRLRLALARGTVALNSIFQPHAHEPDLQDKMQVRIRDQNQSRVSEGRPPRHPREDLDIEHFPDDGLRGVGAASSADQAPARASPLQS